MSRKNEVKRFMRMNLSEYIDGCNEVDCTKMAEDAASHFNIYEDEVDYKIPEWIFDTAFEVSQSHAP